jgi:hypothetical protein
MDDHSQGGWEDIIGRRLITQAETAEALDVKQDSEEVPAFEREGDIVAPESVLETSARDAVADVQATAFAKAEKSLISLGFFTPSSRRIKDQKVKRINFTRVIDGKRVEASVEFHPSAMLGLPITADQDKYLALQDIITNLLQTHGKISNPIRFTSADLLRLLNKRVRTGKNYKDIYEWLNVMTATTIFSKGVVYEAGPGRYAIDRFHVFERAVSVGQELPDGTTADANYVWLSDWQLENINKKYLLPIDLATYRQLKNHIAKALVPLLQVWLFASQRAGTFEKRYDELCEMLGLQIYKAPSLITRQFKPSLDELINFGYLKEWVIEKTSDRKAYKFVLFHGPKFHRDRRRRQEQKHLAEAPVVIAHSEIEEPEVPEPGKLDDTMSARVFAPAKRKGREAVDRSAPEEPAAAGVPLSAPATHGDHDLHTPPAILDQLVARGFVPSVGMKLLNTLSPEQLDRVQDYIDYWDSAENVRPGFLHELIKSGRPLPPGFQTSRQLVASKAAAERKRQIEMAKQSLGLAYDQYTNEVLDRYIDNELPKEQYEHLLQVNRKAMSQQGSFFHKYQNNPTFENMVRRAVRAEIRKSINVLPFDEFCRRESPGILAEYGIDPAALGIDTVPASAEAETEEPE